MRRAIAGCRSGLLAAALVLLASTLGYSLTGGARRASASPTRSPSLWVMNADGSDQVRVGPYVHPLSGFEWSPVDDRLAYSQQGDIFVTRTGGETVNITSTAPTDNVGHETQPSWSPDAARIAFQDGNDLFTIATDGSDRVRLTSGGDFDRWPRWSPAGSQIAFLTGQEPWGPQTLRVVNRNGTGARTLPEIRSDGDFAYGGTSFEWSPDGSRIVFVDNTGGISVVDVETGSISVVTQRAPSGAPTWSPDGARIAFYSQERIFSVAGDGNDERSWQAPSYNAGIDWSPDGRFIASGGYNVTLLDLTSSEATALSVDDDRDEEAWPQWSSSGQQLAFVGWELCCFPNTSPRRVTLRMSRHLVARGRVSSFDCPVTSDVEIQRRRRGHWVVVARTESSSTGGFRVRLPDRTGLYRSVVPRLEIDGPDGTHTCMGDRSERVRHRHGGG